MLTCRHLAEAGDAIKDILYTYVITKCSCEIVPLNQYTKVYIEGSAARTQYKQTQGCLSSECRAVSFGVIIKMSFFFFFIFTSLRHRVHFKV